MSGAAQKGGKGSQRIYIGMVAYLFQRDMFFAMLKDLFSHGFRMKRQI